MPLLHLAPPDAAQARGLLDAIAGQRPTYERIGSTRQDEAPPEGFEETRVRTVVGRGGATFARARAALERWAMYDQRWIRLIPPPTSSEVGVVTVVAARHLHAAWSWNPVRVVWRDASPGRVAFAVAALPGHAEAGEERFSVELEPGGGVLFEMKIHARPDAPLARLASGYARGVQRKFADGATQAMRDAVGSR